MKNPREVIALDNHTYQVPTYRVTDNGIEDGPLIIINLCRGNREDHSVPRQEGLFTESLLEICRQYLTAVNKDQLATRETSIAITKVDETLLWLGKRAEDRKLRGVQATYLK